MSAILAALGVLVAVAVGFVIGWRRGVRIAGKILLPVASAHAMRADIAVKALNIIKLYRPDAFTPEANEIMGHLETMRQLTEPKKKVA